jgi:hypothetical protein
MSTQACADGIGSSFPARRRRPRETRSRQGHPAGQSSAARAAFLSMSISAALQDWPTISANSWHISGGRLEHTTHRP